MGAGTVYSTPCDAMKHVGCVCDLGFRGPECSLQECPSGTDILSGMGNTKGRDSREEDCATTTRASANASRATTARSARCRRYSGRVPRPRLPALTNLKY